VQKTFAFFRETLALTGSGGLQTAGRGATRLAIERRTDAQRHKGRDFVASGGLETAPPSYRTRQFWRANFARANFARANFARANFACANFGTPILHVLISHAQILALYFSNISKGLKG